MYILPADRKYNICIYLFCITILNSVHIYVYIAGILSEKVSHIFQKQTYYFSPPEIANKNNIIQKYPDLVDIHGRHQWGTFLALHQHSKINNKKQDKWLPLLAFFCLCICRLYFMTNAKVPRILKWHSCTDQGFEERTFKIVKQNFEPLERVAHELDW